MHIYNFNPFIFMTASAKEYCSSENYIKMRILLNEKNNFIIASKILIRYKSENFMLSHQNNYAERPSVIMLLQIVLIL